MPETEIPLHYVCTWDEADRLLEGAPELWAERCYCREARGTCERSPHDVCILFTRSATGPDAEPRRITPEEGRGLMALAREKLLVARPFRDYGTRSRTDGICLCCDDCCGYFLNKDDVCDPGRQVESTRMEDCTHCSLCEPVCHFGARSMNGGELEIRREACYGCGLCVAVCPEDCVEMVARPG